VIRLSTILAALALACGGQRLPCYGPEDCSGNACCLEIATTNSGSNGVSCTATPQSCPPAFTVEAHYTRMCKTDADCTAGGISTNEAKCCPSSVMSEAAGTCTGSCLPR
jgi:hypothetical protein